MNKICSALVLLIPLFISNSINGQSGCTDPLANNYNSSATVNNGLCTYNPASLALSSRRDFPNTLNENSGLIFTNGNLWTLNDGGSPASIYKIDQNNGGILQTVSISNAVNRDWEAITADEDYIYIGDFGNNVNGNRTNLRVYRVLKTNIGSGAAVAVTADVIDFSYADQVIENPVTTEENNTSFDCEAFVVINGTLHLFTKDWINLRTKHYTMPAIPGTQLAEAQEEFDVNGLITDAAISFSNPNQIALVGYSADFTSLFMWLLYDYSGDNFFSGNKRRLNLGSPLTAGQMEGVTFNSNSNGFVSGERISSFVSPRFHSFSTSAFVILPVVLSHYDVTLQGSSVRISWQTSSEKENAFFLVEHSANGQDFTVLEKRQGMESSSQIHDYQYIHTSPTDGANYYRLKQVDRDGNETIFQMKMIIVRTIATSLEVYPVPVTGNEVTVRANLETGHFRLYEVVDFAGRVVKKGRLLNARTVLNLSDIQKGNFLLRLDNGDSVRFLKL